MIDSLTKLHTRHSLHLMLPGYIAQATAEHPLALLLLTLRDVELWQDQLTPLAMDKLIAWTAELLREYSPKEAVLARWDYACFAMLLPDHPLWRAGLLADELDEYVCAAALPPGLAIHNISPGLISGAASMPPHDSYSLLSSASHELRNGRGGMFMRLLRQDADAGLRQACVPLLTQFLLHGDPYLRRHAELSSGFCRSVGHKLGMEPAEIDELVIAAAAADATSLQAAGAALYKPGCLTMSEFKRVQNHVMLSAELTARLGLSENICCSVRCHHENLDGSGYPQALSGAQIPLAASVISCCGSYAALLLPRPYRPALTLQQAGAELAAGSGLRWPDRVVRAVLAL